MNRLEARGVGAGESCGDLRELDAWGGGIGVGVYDLYEIGPVRPIQLAGDLDRDPFAGARRESVDIADQKNHGSHLGLLHLHIQRPADRPFCGK
jgi:hypothetical protein